MGPSGVPLLVAPVSAARQTDLRRLTEGRANAAACEISVVSATGARVSVALW
jgi:hypothetical protein